MDGGSPGREHPVAFLKEISTWVDSVLDLDQLLALIIDTATRIMDARASSLLLLDARTRKLYFKVATGEKGEEVKRFEIDVGDGIAGHVAQTGEPLLIPDVSQDARWDRRISESVGFKTRSIACVPMKRDGEILGVLEIIDKNDGGTIGDEDLKTLTIFAEMAASTIGNATTATARSTPNWNACRASWGCCSDRERGREKRSVHTTPARFG